MKVAIAAGGTGGHVFPGIAVAEALTKRGVEVVFLGARRGIERDVIPKHGYVLLSVPIHGFLRKSYSQKLRFPLLLFASLLISLALLLREKPGAVLGCGGYVSFPVLLAALFLGIPTLISEQDSHPGLATRILGRLVDQVHLPTGQAACTFTRKERLRISGNPLRASISPIDRNLALGRFNLKQGVKTVLVFGGSQGARSINRAFSDCLGHLPPTPRLQFIWITGKRDHSWALNVPEHSPFRITVEGFIEDMGYAYSASDLVVSRAGGLATAEITALGLPSILIPFPYATGGHQEVNARLLEKGGAARIIMDEELSGQRLAGEITKLISEPNVLRRMGEKARALCRTNGSERIADAILSLAGVATAG